jgi:hypothetical protein
MSTGELRPTPTFPGSDSATTAESSSSSTSLQTPASPIASHSDPDSAASPVTHSSAGLSSAPGTRPPRPYEHADGFTVEALGEEAIDRRLAEIELIGEEMAAGWQPRPHVPLSPEVRYLHISRTIHQLVTDRNRSVGIFLAVASIVFAASSAMLNVEASVAPIIPLRSIQYWCLPVSFGVLAVLAVFVSLLLIRARIGLIYEVVKMNTLLGLPSQRVERVNPLSIFYLMHLLVVVLGGCAAGFSAGMLAYDMLEDGRLGHAQAEVLATSGDLAVPSPSLASATHLPAGPAAGQAIAVGLVVALAFATLLQSLYYVMILRNTSDSKLDRARP